MKLWKKGGILLMLACMFALVACGGSGGSAREETSIPGLNYKVPETWVQATVTDTNFGAGSGLSQGYRFGERGFASVVYGPNGENMSAEEKIAELEASLSTDQVKESRTQNLTVDGKKASKLTTTVTANGVDMYSETVIIDYEDYCITILVMDVATNKNEVSSGVSTMLNYMKIADLPELTDALESTESTETTVQQTQVQE